MIQALLLILKVSVVALIFAIGLGSTMADAASLWRRPALLIRSMLAMYVAVPIAATLIAKYVPLPIEVRTAFLVLAISCGAPLLPKKLATLGRPQYVLSLAVTSALLAIVFVPAWIEILGRLFGHDLHLEPVRVAMLIAKAFLVPLVIGMLVRWKFAAFAERASDWIMNSASLVLALSGLALLVTQWRVLASVGVVAILSLAGMAAIALAIGHLLGDRDPENRTALAVACSSRNLGVALLAAATVPGPGTEEMVVAYLVASVMVSIPYLKWRGGRAQAPAR